MISLIVPTYNEENALEKTLKGLKQLSLPHELIVADSGSTDGTVVIAKQYADKVVVYEGRPRNAGRGRNTGATAANGDLLAFVDADVSIIDIDAFFTTATALFQKDPKLVAIAARVRALPEVETWGDRISHSLINFMCYIGNNVLRTGAISGEFQMIRTSAFKTLGGYNEALNITEDTDLYVRLSKIGRVRTVRSLLVMHPSRRAHARGWPKLWWELSINWFSVMVFGKPWHDEWSTVR